jgi:hypothetical protein
MIGPQPLGCQRVAVGHRLKTHKVTYGLYRYLQGQPRTEKAFFSVAGRQVVFASSKISQVPLINDPAANRNIVTTPDSGPLRRFRTRNANRLCYGLNLRNALTSGACDDVTALASTRLRQHCRASPPVRQAVKLDQSVFSKNVRATSARSSRRSAPSKEIFQNYPCDNARSRRDSAAGQSPRSVAAGSPAADGRPYDP